MKYAVALAVALLLNATANLMMKFGVREVVGSGGGLLDGGIVGAAKTISRNWILLVGIVCFAANVLFYMYALQRLPISVAYPIMVTCGFAIIVVVAGVKLHERLTGAQWAGVVAILIGVWLVAWDAGRQIGKPPVTQQIAQVDR